MELEGGRIWVFCSGVVLLKIDTCLLLCLSVHPHTLTRTSR